MAGGLGRDTRYVKIAPAMQPLIASTEEELARKEKELEELLHPDVAISQMQLLIGADAIRLADHDPNGPLPEMSTTRGNQTFQAHVVEMARKDDLTIAQTAKRLAASRFNRSFYGTPEQVADTMEAWFHGYGADGFVVTPAMLPSGLYDLCDHVVPLLQKRGVFREDYEGKTLRENLGLPRPPSRHVGHPELHKEVSVWQAR
jgi:alkanesulfonate monooxygenase SsuD/methylene tetrahydromethanopterin reductase-like flavin-dependent oxidoreductase (luciferase family)